MSKSLNSKSAMIQRSLSRKVNVSLFDVVKRLNPFINSKKDKVRPDVNNSHNKITINLDEEAKDEDEMNAV
jgi:hypothetical protein